MASNSRSRPKSRHHVQNQIRQFARGKYIPDLYVRRTFEDQLSRFLQTEPEIAEALKERLHTRITHFAERLEKYPSDFRRRTRSVRVAATKRSTPHEEAVKLIQETEFRELVESQSLQWFTGLLPMITGVSNAIRLLPSDRLITATTEQQRVHSAINNVFEYLQAGPVFPSNFASHIERGFLHFEDAPPVRSTLEGISSEILRYLRLALLVVDRAGSGKTNLLCHVAVALAERQPVILLFGKQQLIGPDSLVKETESIINTLISGLGLPSISALDEVLTRTGGFLNILIDGINENRRLSDLDEAVLHLLGWAREHRIKVVLTCRDIYAAFFQIRLWEDYLQETIRGSLNEFAATEYRQATELYLRYYNISCTLQEEAERACRHPLLLRFFCEAYGNIDGPTVSRGVVRDIRLTELFQVYVDRKIEQIREALGHRDTRMIQRYLYSIALEMFNVSSGVLSLDDLETATGESDTSTPTSIYVRLLDEDIILEEHPGEAIDERKVSFVYEEFMEFLLARSLVGRSGHKERYTSAQLFQLLDDSSQQWVNARGVAAYVGLMLLNGEFGRSRDEAEHFLQAVVDGDDRWKPAFWEVIGKCPEPQLGPDVFDLFPAALPGVRTRGSIQNLLNASSRLSSETAALVAGVLLWSAGLPNVLTWRHLAALPDMSIPEVEAFALELGSRLSAGERHPPLPGELVRAVFDVSKPFLDPRTLADIVSISRSHGFPNAEGDRATVQLLQIIWRAFPTYRPKLINGLFSTSDAVRRICADRLRFGATPQVRHLSLYLSKIEGLSDVGEWLRRVQLPY
jgi:hypothetical protein